MPREINAAWPVLRFGSPNCTVLRYDSEDELCIATLSGIKRITQMDGHFLVDSHGRLIMLGQPRPKVKLGWLQRFWAAMTCKRLQITFGVVSVARETSVDELRDLVAQNLEDYPDFWAGLDLEALRMRLQEATTHSGIIHCS